MLQFKISSIGPLLLLLLFFCHCQSPETETPLRPNILWITSEDMNPMLGCYGDAEAQTPNLDRLAEKGIRYTNAFAIAPVCSPSRSTLITGVYATSMGTQHLRSEVEKPDFIKGFPEYLRAAGYYCTNNYKEDYNFEGKHFWAESSKEAHWRKRAEGQPFFSVFNLETTHQSQIFGTDEDFEKKYGHQLSAAEKQSPATVPLPPYFPDRPSIRKLVARYYDLVTIMDRQAGEILDQLAEDGLAENTIVFYYSDHGTGMPRGKRSLYDSGLQVPLIVYVPEKFQKAYGIDPGTTTDDLVSFVDFAPTILSMLELEIPKYMQGVPFLGKAAGEIAPRQYAFGTSDRVDEAFEFSRSVRGRKYLYIRNYLPHLPLIQPNFYTDQSEIMQELIAAREEGGLGVIQKKFWEPRRMAEELYDVESDPHQVKNLVYNTDLNDVLVEMRSAHQDWMRRTHDTGMMPETYMYRTLGDRKPYDTALDPDVLPIDRFLEIAEAGREGNFDLLHQTLTEDQPLLQFWSLNNLQYYGVEAGLSASELQQLIDRSKAPEVKMAALPLLCELGDCSRHLPMLVDYINGDDPQAMLMAARTYQLLGDRVAPLNESVKSLYPELEEIAQDWSKYYKLYTYWALKEAGVGGLLQ